MEWLRNIWKIWIEIEMDLFVIEKILDVGSSFICDLFKKKIDIITVLELAKQASKQRNKAIKILHVIGMRLHFFKWGYEILPLSHIINKFHLSRFLK